MSVASALMAVVTACSLAGDEGDCGAVVAGLVAGACLAAARVGAGAVYCGAVGGDGCPDGGADREDAGVVDELECGFDLRGAVLAGEVGVADPAVALRSVADGAGCLVAEGAAAVLAVGVHWVRPFRRWQQGLH